MVDRVFTVSVFNYSQHRRYFLNPAPLQDSHRVGTISYLYLVPPHSVQDLGV